MPKEGVTQVVALAALVVWLAVVLVRSHIVVALVAMILVVLITLMAVAEVPLVLMELERMVGMVLYQ